MTQTERVTVDDMRRVAELAHLELTAAEEASMLRDLNSILDHVAQLNELDTSSVPAMAQVGEILGSEVSAGRGLDDAPLVSLREDEVLPSLDRALVVSGAPDSDSVYFRVPKVIER
jgi:aspartyl-tRNA(Asn)/glutamyl-tRNA(Gln) amidotransferase subunit C